MTGTVERGKFPIDGECIDVDTYGRLRSDSVPRFDPVEMRTRPQPQLV